MLALSNDMSPKIVEMEMASTALRGRQRLKTLKIIRQVHLPADFPPA